MKDGKNIDNNIREKLESFQVSPPPHLWNNVQEKLIAGRRRSRMVYMTWISTAAIIVLAFIAGWYFNENANTEKTVSIPDKVVEQDKTNTEPAKGTIEIASLENDSEKNSGEMENNQFNSSLVTSSSSYRNVQNDSEIAKLNNNPRQYVALAKLESAKARVVSDEKPNSELAISSYSISDIGLSQQEQMLVAENIRNFDVNKEKENAWKMGMFVAPGYSSFNANHNETYASNMTDSGNGGNTNVSGGVSVQYKTKKRWIFESGVYYAQSGQESQNPGNLLSINRDADYLYAPESAPEINSNVRIENEIIVMNSTAGIIEFQATPEGAALGGEFDAANSKDANVFIPEGQYSQVFDFMEIPLYVRYRVVDSKFGLELITGLNAGIIVGNNSYLNNQYGTQNIGETKDISTLNLSGTLGLGLNYALGKHFSVALEPRYNYYLNSINTNSSVDFRPYRIGLFTGLTYEF